MLIGGLQKLTLIDYPGKIACTVFTVGCNFRCHFCHNPELINPAEFKLSEIIEEKTFFDFLGARRGLLDGVCITGGEPTLYPELLDFIKKIKMLGFFVKLDTNGTNPEMIKAFLAENLIDYIAMDIKQVPSSKFQVLSLYEKVVGVSVNLEDIGKSIKIIMESGLDYEFRTTVVPGLHNKENIIKIAEFIKGAKKYYLQQFRAGEKILAPEFREIKSYPPEFFKELHKKIKDNFEICEVRE